MPAPRPPCVAATCVLALAACSFADEGLGSATSLGATTTTDGGTSGAGHDESASSGGGEGEASSSQETNGSSGSSSSVESTEGGTTETVATGSSGGAGSDSSSTGPAPVCGNGIVEPPEPCDGAQVQVQCSDLDANTMGKPDCNGDCTLDLEPCCDVAGEPCGLFDDDCCGSCVLMGIDLVCV